VPQPVQPSGWNGGGDARQIEEAADGSRRGALGETGRNPEIEAEGRFERDGRVDEREAARGDRPHQAQGSPEERLEVGGGCSRRARNLAPRSRCSFVQEYLIACTSSAPRERPPVRTYPLHEARAEFSKLVE